MKITYHLSDGKNERIPISQWFWWARSSILGSPYADDFVLYFLTIPSGYIRPYELKRVTPLQLSIQYKCSFENSLSRGPVPNLAYDGDDHHESEQLGNRTCGLNAHRES